MSGTFPALRGTDGSRPPTTVQSFSHTGSHNCNVQLGSTYTFEHICAVLSVRHEQDHLPTGLRVQQVDLGRKTISVSLSRPQQADKADRAGNEQNKNQHQGQQSTTAQREQLAITVFHQRQLSKRAIQTCVKVCKKVRLTFSPLIPPPQVFCPILLLSKITLNINQENK